MKLDTLNSNKEYTIQIRLVDKGKKDANILLDLLRSIESGDILEVNTNDENFTRALAMISASEASDNSVEEMVIGLTKTELASIERAAPEAGADIEDDIANQDDGEY